MPRCVDCKTEKPHEEFYGIKKKASRCKQCQSKYLKAYRAKERTAALIAYGGENPTCSCPGCSEDRFPFLCIDHINGGGCKHREELCKDQLNNRDDAVKFFMGKCSPGGGVFYRWLRKNLYPSGYRVLCYNCNTARSNGPCPVHESS